MKITNFELVIGMFALAGLSSAYADEASEYCTSKGGRIEIYQLPSSGSQENENSATQVGICRLGESGIGEWTLYNSNTKKRSKAVQAYLSHPQYEQRYIGVVGNTVTPAIKERAERLGGETSCQIPQVPILSYCRQLGGQIMSLNSEIHNKVKVCIFDDFSAIDAQTLLFGPNHAKNVHLTDLLSQ